MEIKADKKKEILQFLKDNPKCYLATVDGDRPRVRGLLLYQADKNGLVFQTWGFKDLYRQLQKNQNVEICFPNSDGSRQVRVSGRVEFIEDQKLKEEIVSERDFLKPVVEEKGYEEMRVSGWLNAQPPCGAQTPIWRQRDTQSYKPAFSAAVQQTGGRTISVAL